MVGYPHCHRGMPPKWIISISVRIFQPCKQTTWTSNMQHEFSSKDMSHVSIQDTYITYSMTLVLDTFRYGALGFPSSLGSMLVRFQAFETDSTQPWPRNFGGFGMVGVGLDFLGVKNSPSARNLVKNAGCKIIEDLKMLTMFRRKTKKGGGFEWPQEVKTNVISSINCLNLEDPCLK